MAGMSGRPPSMYWCVGPGGNMLHPEAAMDTDTRTGARDMGSKESTLGVDPEGRCPRAEGIQAAYQRGDQAGARRLLREACDESSSQQEKHQLLSLSAASGDLEAVRYLLMERGVELRTEPTDDNPAVLAAQLGHTNVVRELLESLPGPCRPQCLLNWMLALACQCGHLGVVRLLVLTHGADPESCAVRKKEFPAIARLPLYAAIKAGNEDIAIFLLRHGAFFCSYILLDSPDSSKHLLRKYFVEAGALPNVGPGKMPLCVKWAHLRLPWVDLDWLLDISCQITELDLSANCLVSLPSVIPWGLISLRKLSLAQNQLAELPGVQSSDEIICSRLLEIDISSNRLSHLPAALLHLSKLQKLTASKNYLERLFEEESATNWIGLRKLQELDLSDNKLTELPATFLHSFKSLSYLNVSRNNLKVFPEAWACPLKCCQASRNALGCLPDKMAVFWKNHLKDVDFSENALREVPLGLFQLDALMFLRLQGNQLVALPPPDKWTCRQLKTLDLARNQFGKNEDGLKTKRISLFTTRGRQRSGTETACMLEFPAFLSESLEVLCLNDNLLDAVPPSVCLLRNLSELYLGNNPGLRELPPELGQLGNLWQLDTEELSISNVPADIRKEGPKAVLSFLRAQLRRAERCRLLKMILVGPPRQGKSTLLEILQTGRAPQLPPPEAAIRTTKWELQRPAGYKAKEVESVEFSVWDMGGPASMATVNQCFFTDKALYVVVWNLALGEEAVASLQFWLLNIEAKAPNAVVLVVGTHLDLIETKFRVERIATLRAYVLALCRSPSGSRATGFPDITCKHLHELSCKSLEGQEGLRQLIFHVTCNMKDVGSTIGCQKLAGRLIPRSYLSLQEAVLAEQQRRRLEDAVQYLTDRQLEQLVEQMPGNDIRDYEDLQSAISFLIETGTLLHFPDTSRGLHNLYFLDPIWLSECLQRIFSIKGSRSVARNGVIRAEDLRLLLVGTGFTQQTEEQYFQFLAKFEIALPVAHDSYLLPHLLPSKPGLDTHGLRHPSANSIQRVFKMSFVPVGFWQRFIARMLISLAEMDLQLFENKKNTKSRHRKVAIYSFTGNQRNRCSTFRVKRNQTIYWQEGLLVTFDGGYLSVESSDVNWKKKKSGGIKIICQSEVRDFSAMAFITDHVNSLIDQWFPALTATESDGTPLMEQYVPCPVCETSCALHAEPSQRATEGLQYFNMEDCVLTAIERDIITCPMHPDVPVPLQELVPELFMTDFPARLFLENSQLEHSEDEGSVLGQGGSGTVIYRARYQGQPVAVKRFHIKKFKNMASTPADTMLRHLRATDAMKNFSEFRQEASMLHALQHPCIVSLIGISIHPLCFALELAPLGSLNTVLADNARDASFMPLGHMLTQKVAYQIASGLAYLHKKNIIFCDLKSDNILVWSLDVKELVNIKLSDYGISRQSFHEGALGVEGTPGYQAPEIRPRVVYDEKVDMFSYGMVLYELLSGQRPALGHHQLQIAKKLSKGVRPVLGPPEEVQFYRLQTLMMECWDTKPEKRPLALSVVSRMKDPTFAAFMYQLPCGRQTAFFSPQGPETTVVFWDGKEESRNYTVVNTEKGLLEVERMSCAGMKLSCQLKVQSALWTATEDQKIYIYNLKGMCPLSTPQRALDTPAVVTCFLAVPIIKKNCYLVLAGLADGLVAAFSVVRGAPAGCSYLCSHTANRAKFGIPDDDARQNPYPVRAMEVANSGGEVWYGNGPGLLVVDCEAVDIRRRLEPFRAPSAVASLACSSEGRGEEVVWCLDDRASSLVMYHAATYQLCARYFCGDPSPLRDVFPVRPLGFEPPATQAGGPQEQGGGSIADVSIMYSKELGTQILTHQDSLTDYCSMSSYSSSPPGFLSPTGLPSSPASSASAPFSTDAEDSERLQEALSGSDLTPVDGEAYSQHLQAVKVLAVKDLIWVPRRGGDIIIIGLEKDAGAQRGRVLAVLKARELTSRGALVDAAVVAKDMVLCAFKNEDLQWCLGLWRGWGARDFDIFYRSYEELGRLEACPRKRR